MAIGFRVLVLDDDENILSMLRAYLEEAGFEVITATRGKEALELAWKACPDVAIVDIVLPDTTGWQVCSHLKKDFRTSHVRIVVLSAQSPDLAGPLMQIMGLEHFIQKPADPKQIVELAKSLALQNKA